MGAVGAAVVAAGGVACRKPREHILPYARRPEDLIPGKPAYFATSMNVGGSVFGLLVESHEGRPTKIEGNPKHPNSLGGTHAWAQAEILGLYDPERSKGPIRKGEAASKAELDAFLTQLVKALDETGGEGLGVLIDGRPSPTQRRLLGEFLAKYKGARVFEHDPADPGNERAGAKLAGLGDVELAAIGQAEVIVAFDSDFMWTDADPVRQARMFADGRRSPTPGSELNRLYSIGPRLTVTSAAADDRLRLPASQVGDALALLALKLGAVGKGPSGVPTPKLSGDAAAKAGRFIQAIADDLASRGPGTTRIVVGDNQPAPVHALALAINAALGNLQKTVLVRAAPRILTEDLNALSDTILSGNLRRLVILGGNPGYTAPPDLEVGTLVKQVPISVHLGAHRDETGMAATWHIPASHFLEAWGDLEAKDGTVSIQQPLIAPLYDSMSEIELLGRMLGETKSGYDLVRQTWSARTPDGFERHWQRWLHDGVVDTAKATPSAASPAIGGLTRAWKSPDLAGLELIFAPDASVLDGRFAMNPWLQELPDPITKLTWDNAAQLSNKTAADLGVQSGQLIQINRAGRKCILPAWITPGIADGCLVLPVGYGRRFGQYAKGGFDVGLLRDTQAGYFASGATASKAAGTYPLSNVQQQSSLQGRSHIREADVADFKSTPNFVSIRELMDPKNIHSPWEEPNATGGHQWGMSIDLNTCIGCSACTVACQAENNIPWVGKEEVGMGREMHWIRLDRYFEGEGDDVNVQLQPIACTHCETAPCENVCPVAATTHSPEGLNDMAYNRCIGTRYCANNCPYKVRRFNFFNYSKRAEDTFGMGLAMQRNPDVTVRFRGVIEKCTYCVQRVNAARIVAKRDGDGVIADGAIVPACGQACPTQAITFGNVSDPESQVSKLKKDPRNYAVLAELNIRPRTSFLAKLNNPNPKLGAKNG